MAAERGRDLIEMYGSYPVSKTFAVTDNVPDLAETDMPTYSAAFDVDPTTKRHAACDECSESDQWVASVDPTNGNQGSAS